MLWIKSSQVSYRAFGRCLLRQMTLSNWENSTGHKERKILNVANRSDCRNTLKNKIETNDKSKEICSKATTTKVFQQNHGSRFEGLEIWERIKTTGLLRRVRAKKALNISEILLLSHDFLIQKLRCTYE